MKRQEFLERNADTAAGRHTVPGWNRLALEAIRTARLPAPVAARVLAILHTCMYNAWAAYDDAARQTAGGVAVRLPCGERHGTGRTIAIGHAAHLALSTRFPARRAAFDAHLAQLLRPLTSSPSRAAGVLTPAGIGRVQAASLLDACGQDGAMPPFPAIGMGQVCERWCTTARRLSEREHHDDDRDVLLFFVLANALDNVMIALRTPDEGKAGSLLLTRLPAAGARLREGCDDAAGEVLHRFVSAMETPADTPAAPSWGQALGALVFERARRHWQGHLLERARAA
jgi:hypothetical protein